MMERLTKRQSDGSVIAWHPLEYYNYNDFKKVIDRLAYYEDLEEQGRLVVLPCKVGDTVYFRTYAKNATVDLGIQPHEVVATRAYVVTKGEFTDVGHPLWNFGKTVFLTREEAEQALKGGAD